MRFSSLARWVSGKKTKIRKPKLCWVKKKKFKKRKDKAANQIDVEAHRSAWKDLRVLAATINRKFVFAKVCERIVPFLTFANAAETPLKSKHASSKVSDISLKNGKQVQLQLTLCII